MAPFHMELEYLVFLWTPDVLQHCCWASDGYMPVRLQCVP